MVPKVVPIPHFPTLVLPTDILLNSSPLPSHSEVSASALAGSALRDSSWVALMVRKTQPSQLSER